ncbi:MAG: Z1 domain-containing protein [Deltaproteobacteria bacterium]|nr:Z1 domain-containing protein [Deltaproteobacteria bacterium]
MENLIAWLKEHNAISDTGIEHHPMLMIDDEADNASINTSKDPDESTRINGLIRKTLNLFHKCCYVGYTATPFANIFIDPDSEEEMLGGDLFPRDFIVSLDAPDNYVGPEKIFGENNDLNIIRYINDYEDLLPIRHKKDYVITDLPSSLYQAVFTFILVIAVRLLRGQIKKHNSMLVNISWLTNIQSQVRNILHEYLQELIQQIRFNYAKPVDNALKNSLMGKLHEHWKKEFGEEEFCWNEIQSVLLDAAAPVKIIEINSQSSDTLDYENYKKDGLNIIAVGGFSLSRGLTLEGLSVSYFLRNSIMYDTLMQMGRWFGYRPGYEDLCRVFMPSLAAGWYAHISEATEELKAELRQMELANLTPKDFGLKVRSHPDSLIVTARNKMRTGEKVTRLIDLSKKLIETDKLFRSQSDIKQNRNLLSNFIGKLKEIKAPGFTKAKNYLWKNVPAELVTGFLSGYRNHPASIRTSTTPVVEYINKRKGDELEKWDVAIINKDGVKNSDKEQLHGIAVGCQDRSAGVRSEQLSDCIMVGKKARVGSTRDEREGLSQREIEKAEQLFKEAPGQKANAIAGHYYRKVRARPLLIIHLLNIIYEPKSEQKPSHKGVVAYGISFPESRVKDSPVQYVVNTTWWKTEYGYDLEGDEDE